MELTIHSDPLEIRGNIGSDTDGNPWIILGYNGDTLTMPYTAFLTAFEYFETQLGGAEDDNDIN